MVLGGHGWLGLHIIRRCPDFEHCSSFLSGTTGEYGCFGLSSDLSMVNLLGYCVERKSPIFVLMFVSLVLIDQWFIEKHLCHVLRNKDQTLFSYVAL